ncbi:MAG: ROK family protein [Candidatus Omnitrophota bacterium]
MPKKFVIAIDLGGTNLKIALLDSEYRIQDRGVLSTKKFIKKESLICAIVDSVNNIIESNNLKIINILGIGLGLPGPIDIARGIVHFFPNIPGWKKVNLKSILKKRLGLAVFLDNDAKLMCLAEHKLGAARGARSAVCLTLGTGVGGAIIINGELYRGSSNAAGEIGHFPLNERGPRCNCGAQACLEAYIGNNRVLQEAKKLFRRDVSLEELSSLAKKQNKKALSIWSGVARRLGVTLSGVVNLLNPDCIVIGGGMAGAGRALLDNLRKVILKRAMSVQARQVKVYAAKLGNDAGLIGAAILVREATGE